MRTGHIIYTVKNLETAVKQWQDKGFTVEYGKKKNPINALIYFSEGPYIELMQGGGMSPFSKFIMRLIGKGKFMDRFDYWDNCEEGYSCLAIEKDPGNLDKEIKWLNSQGITGTYMKSLKRTDSHDRELHYGCYFTDDVSMPFLMSYFDIDPKPKNYVHPNGISCVKKVKYTTSQKYADALQYLVQNNRLEVIVKEGVMNIEVAFDKI